MDYLNIILLPIPRDDTHHHITIIGTPRSIDVSQIETRLLVAHVINPQ